MLNRLTPQLARHLAILGACVGAGCIVGGIVATSGGGSGERGDASTAPIVFETSGGPSTSTGADAAMSPTGAPTRSPAAAPTPSSDGSGTTVAEHRGVAPRSSTAPRLSGAAAFKLTPVFCIAGECHPYRVQDASERGATSDAGPGPRGEQGARGTTGARGVAGTRGAKGEQGSAGAVGAAGPPGANGARGADGDRGAPGDRGADGPRGATGPKGATGDRGANGADGAVGPAGAPGAQGATGLTGATGAVGPAGPIGPAGATGPAGPIGPAGAVGPAGAIGPAGPAGPAGPIGPAGSVGPAGAAGPAGATGAAGASAYDIAVAGGFAGTEAQWIASLDGGDWQGTWDIATPYDVGDIVSYAGVTYIARTAHVGSTPSTISTDWYLAGERFTGATAGGDLDGSYPNPTIKLGAVTNDRLAGDAVTADKIAAGAVGSSEIGDLTQGLVFKRGSTTGPIVDSQSATFDPWLRMLANGRVEWGPGSGATDTFLERIGVDTLQTGNLAMTGTLKLDNANGIAWADGVSTLTRTTVAGGGIKTQGLELTGDLHCGASGGCVGREDLIRTPAGELYRTGPITYAAATSGARQLIGFDANAEPPSGMWTSMYAAPGTMTIPEPGRYVLSADISVSTAGVASGYLTLTIERTRPATVPLVIAETTHSFQATALGRESISIPTQERLQPGDELRVYVTQSTVPAGGMTIAAAEFSGSWVSN